MLCLDDCYPKRRTALLWFEVMFYWWMTAKAYPIIYERLKNIDIYWLRSSLWMTAIQYTDNYSFVLYVSNVFSALCWLDNIALLLIWFSNAHFLCITECTELSRPIVKYWKVSEKSPFTKYSEFFPAYCEKRKISIDEQEIQHIFLKIQRLVFEAFFCISSSISVYRSSFNGRFGATEGFTFHFLKHISTV